MSETPHMVECFLCKRSFQFGPHIYVGKRIPPWGMMVCNECHRGNRDGIVPANHPHLVPYLQSRGIQVRYNVKGSIDWPTDETSN